MKQLKVLLPYLKQHALWLIAGFVCMVLQNYGYMKTPGYIQQALDEITNKNRLDLVRSHLWMIALYTTVTVVGMFLMRKLIIGVSRKIEYQLRERLYQKLLDVDMTFFQKNETGDLVSRCTNDLNEVRMLLGPGVMYVPNALTRIILFLPILIGLSAPLMLAVTLLLALIMGFIIFLMPRLRPLYRHIQEAVGKINSRVWQVISGISTVKLYTLEPIEIERFKRLNEEYIGRHMRVVKFRGFLWPFLIFLFSITELLILFIGGRQVIQQDMSIGQLLQFNIMISHIAFPIFSLSWIMSLLQQGISAMARINYILEYPVESHVGKQTLDTEELTFTLKDLSYRYPEHRTLAVPADEEVTRDDAEEPQISEIEGPVLAPPMVHPPTGITDGHVLKHITLTIEPGQTVGITGTIGSGKSTLLNLMTGLYKPEPGMLFINGVDVREVDPHSLFKKIAVVAQEPFLFSRTIAENISLHSDHAEHLASIEEAARQAGIAGDIDTSQQRYDQIIGERGITLSGGQKQRTAIARALFKRSPVLMLDDSLSSVDANTESQILENLRNDVAFNTLVIVSHRISALKNTDRIYVLDNGMIVEQGTHAELLHNNHLYARLATMQQMEMEMEGNYGTASEDA